MMDFAAAADRLLDTYNTKVFATLEALMSPDLDFAHFNRDFAFRRRESGTALRCCQGHPVARG
jgi:hypothetical protein